MPFGFFCLVLRLCIPHQYKLGKGDKSQFKISLYWAKRPIRTVTVSSLESPLDCEEIQPVYPKENQSWIFIGRTGSWNSNILASSCEERTQWKRPWCWEIFKAGREGDDRGWDGWMVSLTWWTWVWVSSGSWWWTGKPSVLQSMGLQRVRHYWVTELN